VFGGHGFSPYEVFQQFAVVEQQIIHQLLEKAIPSSGASLSLTTRVSKIVNACSRTDVLRMWVLVRPRFARR
jgi:hypothetical protein